MCAYVRSLFLFVSNSDDNENSLSEHVRHVSPSQSAAVAVRRFHSISFFAFSMPFRVICCLFEIKRIEMKIKTG